MDRTRDDDGTQDVSARPHSRDKYRDNDDVRDPLPADQRAGTSPDTRNEARGDARENVGNTARGTDADPTGPEGNDRTRGDRRTGSS
ncbi:MAG TPA: hypothetical protein VFS08_05955 [Gemmatimonadaceae bacterium]|nr:hypothetical protein [Gemmatimonadaceae bacterium]